jgi:hypothetical protein
MIHMYHDLSAGFHLPIDGFVFGSMRNRVTGGTDYKTFKYKPWQNTIDLYVYGINTTGNRPYNKHEGEYIILDVGYKTLPDFSKTKGSRRKRHRTDKEDTQITLQKRDISRYHEYVIGQAVVCDRTLITETRKAVLYRKTLVMECTLSSDATYFEAQQIRYDKHKANSAMVVVSAFLLHNSHQTLRGILNTIFI